MLAKKRDLNKKSVNNLNDYYPARPCMRPGMTFFLLELNLLHASKLTNIQCINILFCCLTSLHTFSFLKLLILLLSANAPHLKGA